jgi:hypothetical protein
MGRDNGEVVAYVWGNVPPDKAGVSAVMLLEAAQPAFDMASFTSTMALFKACHTLWSTHLTFFYIHDILLIQHEAVV